MGKNIQNNFSLEWDEVFEPLLYYTLFDIFKKVRNTALHMWGTTAL